MRTIRRTASAITAAVLMVTVTACDRDTDPAVEVDEMMDDEEEMTDDDEMMDDEEMSDDEATS